MDQKKKKRDDMNRSYLLIGELYVSVAFSVRYEIHLILCMRNDRFNKDNFISQ